MSLGFDFLLEFFDPGLKLLDLLLQFADEGLFIFQLGGDGGQFLVLSLDSLLQLLFVPLEISNGFLGQFQVTFDFPLGLLHVAAVT